jgi:hypothetical protein
MVPAPNTAFVRLSDGTVIGTAATAQAPKRTLKATSVVIGSIAAAKAGELKKPATTTSAKKSTSAKKNTSAKKGNGSKAPSTTRTTTP